MLFTYQLKSMPTLLCFRDMYSRGLEDAGMNSEHLGDWILAAFGEEATVK